MNAELGLGRKHRGSRTYPGCKTLAVAETAGQAESLP